MAMEDDSTGQAADGVKAKAGART